VERVIAIIREDMDRTLRLLGVASVGTLTREVVRTPPGWDRS